MANSKYEYTRAFEQPDHLLPATWIVVRVDGRGFHAFSERHGFAKPNDARALSLMNAAAAGVLAELPDIRLAYGHSDEFSFVFHRDTRLFERRAAKLVSTVVSAFTARYVFLWSKFFDDGLQEEGLPGFDGRAVCYPGLENLRDYLSWRQVDCHINNLYNTTFWGLVQKAGMSHRAAEQELAGTVSAQKNEILFSRFGINYNKEPEMFKKGGVVFRDYEEEISTASHGGVDSRTSAESEPPEMQIRNPKKPDKMKVVIRHIDIIKDEFWDARPWILGNAGTVNGGKKAKRRENG